MSQPMSQIEGQMMAHVHSSQSCLMVISQECMPNHWPCQVMCRKTLPDLNNGGGGNGHGILLTNPIVVAGNGDLVLQFSRNVRAGWYIAAVGGRRVHVYRHCDGLRRASV